MKTEVSIHDNGDVHVNFFDTETGAVMFICLPPAEFVKILNDLKLEIEGIQALMEIENG